MLSRFLVAGKTSMLPVGVELSVNGMCAMLFNQWFTAVMLKRGVIMGITRDYGR